MKPGHLNDDRSETIELTPAQIKHMLFDFAQRYHNSRLRGVNSTLQRMVDTYYQISMAMLEAIDPTRFKKRTVGAAWHKFTALLFFD